MEYRKLKEVGKIISGFAFKSKDFSPNNGTPVVRISNITNDAEVDLNIKDRKFYPFEIDSKMSKFIIQKGDILIALSGATTGKIGIYQSDRPALLNQRVALIRGKTIDDSKYLYYFLRSKSKGILNDAYGGAQPNISPKTIGEYELFYSENENIRKTITEAFETQFTRLDAAIKSLRTIKDKIEFYRGSILKAAFSNKLVSLKCNWKKSTIKDVSRKIQYGLTSQSGMQFKGSKYLRITDIQNRKVDWNSVPYAKEADRIDDYKLNVNDLVFVRTGATVGKSFLIKECPKNAVFASYLIRIVPNLNKIVPDLLWYYFQSPMYWHDISRSQRGIGQPNVNGKILSGLKVNIPLNLKAQDRLVQEIESRFSVIDKVGEVVDNALKKAQALRRSILKAAFEGKLVKKGGAG